MANKKVVRIGIIIGSKSDLSQCVLGLTLLQDRIARGEVEIVFLRVGSIHRNTDEVLNWVREAHEKQSVDAIITGAGWANHLSGTVDAYLRHTLKNTTIQVFAVAFEDLEDTNHTRAAILSITQVPGHQMIFHDFIGAEGFLEACRMAAEGQGFKELKVPSPRLTEELNLAETLRLVSERT